jgi:hypothetical protein
METSYYIIKESNTNQTFSNLIGMILDETVMRNYGNSKHLPTASKTCVFFARNQYKGNNWRQRNSLKFKNKVSTTNNTNDKPTYSKHLICHYCGKPNHIRSNCKAFAQDKLNGVFKP